MHRRSFLLALASSAFVFLVSRLPGNRYGAVFRVSYVDPEVSGADFRNHLGMYVYNARRCCKNCQIIFGAFTPGGETEFGPFGNSELTPINAQAERILAEIKASNTFRSVAKSSFGLAS